jgi:hypothetical protein
MPKPKSRKKKTPKRVLALPDLEHAKTTVLNSLTSASGQRTYDHAIREFVDWCCSEPRRDSLRAALGPPRVHGRLGRRDDGRYMMTPVIAVASVQ